MGCNPLNKTPKLTRLTQNRPQNELSNDFMGVSATKTSSYLRPVGKGQKLAWQGVLHENTMMLRMRMLPNLLPVATRRRCPRGG